MKKLLALIFLLLSVPVYAEQTTATFSYGSVTGITGFKLYCATAKPYPATPVATITAAARTATFDLPGGLTPLTYTCVVRSYVQGGQESANSNEASKTVAAVAPPAPTNLQLTLELTINQDGTAVVRIKATPIKQVVVVR